MGKDKLTNKEKYLVDLLAAHGARGAHISSSQVASAQSRVHNRLKVGAPQTLIRWRYWFSGILVSAMAVLALVAPALMAASPTQRVTLASEIDALLLDIETDVPGGFGEDIVLPTEVEIWRVE